MTTHQDTNTERDTLIDAARQALGFLRRQEISYGDRVAGQYADKLSDAVHAALASRDEAAQQPQGQAVSDEQIASIVRAVEDKDKVPSFSNGFYTLTPEELSAFTSSILALRPDHFPDARKMMQLSDDFATIAGLESAVGHLSTLVDEQRALLVESEDVFGRDGHGGKYEDGECELIDRIRSHLDMTAPPPNGITAKEQGNEN